MDGLAAKAGVSTTRFSSLVPSRFVRKPGTAQDKRKDGRYAGRVRLAVVPDRSADSLCGFVESAVAPRTLTVTDDWSGYASLGKRGYEHFAVAECGDPEVAEDYLPIIHLVFANLKRGSSASITVSAISIFKPISMSSRSALTGASTHSTPSAPSSASLAMSAHRPSMNSIQGNGSTLHVVGECVNRIGKEQASYERFLASVREAFSSTMANRSVGDVVFSPLLGDVEELNVWIEKRHPWAIGALSVVSRRIPMPEWVADREREVKLALSQGKCPKSRLSDRDDLFGINDVV